MAAHATQTRLLRRTWVFGFLVSVFVRCWTKWSTIQNSTRPSWQPWTLSTSARSSGLLCKPCSLREPAFMPHSMSKDQVTSRKTLRPKFLTGSILFFPGDPRCQYGRGSIQIVWRWPEEHVGAHHPAATASKSAQKKQQLSVNSIFPCSFDINDST